LKRDLYITAVPGNPLTWIAAASLRELLEVLVLIKISGGKLSQKKARERKCTAIPTYASSNQWNLLNAALSELESICLSSTCNTGLQAKYNGHQAEQVWA
jgi:hypothetical protein